MQPEPGHDPPARRVAAEVRPGVPRPAGALSRPGGDSARHAPDHRRGEFEALLLGQAPGDLDGGVTTGGSTKQVAPESRDWAFRCGPWYAAHDADQSGDRAAASLPGPSIRVRPPAGKDRTESLHRGIDPRRWWLENILVEAFDREERKAIREVEAGSSSVRSSSPAASKVGRASA